MNKQTSKTQTKPTQLLFAVAVMIALIPASDAFGHQWTLDGRKVEATVADFNQTHILLADAKGNEKAIPIADLTDGDVDYLAKIVEIRDAKVRENFQRVQTQQNQIELLSQFSDMWYVSLMAPNGRYFTRPVFANDSRQASYVALNNFPNARVLGVRKQNQRSRF